MTQPEYTYPVAGDNVCKVCSADQSVVLDDDENVIGSVLTCVSDMGIGWYKNKIYSIASPGKPEGFTPHGLCCGYVKVKKMLEIGQTLFLQDNRRTIRVRWSKIFARIAPHAGLSVKCFKKGKGGKYEW
jgi:aminomethyltransferase